MEKKLHRVQVDLGREDIEFLNRVSVDAKFKDGRVIPRTVCIRAVLAAIRDLDLPPGSFRDGQTLLSAVKESVCSPKKKKKK